MIMMRFRPLLWFIAALLPAQIIDFESNGLHYKTLTKSGVTVMFAYLPAHLKEYSIVQVSISNGSPIAWMVKPEDFSYKRQDGTIWQAAPALAVVNSLLAKASRHDVVKLVTTYEAGLYGNTNFQSRMFFRTPYWASPGSIWNGCRKSSFFSPMIFWDGVVSFYCPDWRSHLHSFSCMHISLVGCARRSHWAHLSYHFFLHPITSWHVLICWPSRSSSFGWLPSRQRPRTTGDLVFGSYH